MHQGWLEWRRGRPWRLAGTRLSPPRPCGHVSQQQLLCFLYFLYLQGTPQALGLFLGVLPCPSSPPALRASQTCATWQHLPRPTHRCLYIAHSRQAQIQVPKYVPVSSLWTSGLGMEDMVWLFTPTHPTKQRCAVCSVPSEIGSHLNPCSHTS